MAKDRGSMLAPIDPVLRELGRLVFNFNSVEHGMRRIAFLMIAPDDERIGEITVDRLGSSGLEELVRSLASYRLKPDDLIARVNAAVNRFGVLRQSRNDFVHAQWVVPNKFGGPEDILAVKRRFRKGVTSPVASLDPGPIGVAASEASRLGDELEALHASIKHYFFGN